MCKEQVLKSEVERNLDVCPKCSYHFPISVEKRIAITFDPGSFAELYPNIEPVDFLDFEDTKSYRSRLAESKEATGKAIPSCAAADGSAARAFSAPSSISASWGPLGSVAGEKIARSARRG